MPVLQYGIYILISRPRYDEKVRAWLPYASVSWKTDKFNYYRLNDLEHTFQTENEALAFGYLAGRAWIRDRNSNRTNKTKCGYLNS